MTTSARLACVCTSSPQVLAAQTVNPHGNPWPKERYHEPQTCLAYLPYSRQADKMAQKIPRVSKVNFLTLKQTKKMLTRETQEGTEVWWLSAWGLFQGERYSETKRLVILVFCLPLKQVRKTSAGRPVVSKLLHFSFVLFQGFRTQALSI